MNVIERAKTHAASIKEWANAKVTGVVVLGTASASAAMAQEAGGSDAFATAVTTITGNVQNYGAALVGLAAVGVVFMIAMKYVKKLRSAG